MWANVRNQSSVIRRNSEPQMVELRDVTLQVHGWFSVAELRLVENIGLRPWNLGFRISAVPP